jgi:hypothetical protein
MTGRTRLQRALTVAAAVTLTVVVSDALTFAATGSSLILGRINQANATTTIQNTGVGSALKLVTKAVTTPPLVVNGKGKVTNLYADRAATADNAAKLGGLTPAQIAATMKGPKGDTGAKGSNGVNGAQGPAGPSGPTFGRLMIGVNGIDPGSSVGSGNSIAIGLDGNPVMTYFDSQNLVVRIAKCSRIDCSNVVNAHTLFTTTSGFVTSSLTIGPDGNPTVALYVSATGDLVVDHCHDSTCTAGTTSTAVDSMGDVGGYPSITYGTDGFPVIAYYDATNGHPKVAHCVDAGCEGAANKVTIDQLSADNDGQYTSITIGTDGMPVLAYEKALAAFAGSRPVVAKCITITCSGATVVRTIGTAMWSGAYTSLAIGADGNPVVAYYDATTGHPALATCVDATCAGTPITAVLDPATLTGDGTSLVIGTDGNPIVAYPTAGVNQLRIAFCTTRTCTGTVTQRVVATGLPFQAQSSMTLGADGNPVIAFYSASTDGLQVAKVTHSSWTTKGWGH